MRSVFHIQALLRASNGADPPRSLPSKGSMLCGFSLALFKQLLGASVQTTFRIVSKTTPLHGHLPEIITKGMHSDERTEPVRKTQVHKFGINRISLGCAPLGASPKLNPGHSSRTGMVCGGPSLVETRISRSEVHVAEQEYDWPKASADRPTFFRRTAHCVEQIHLVAKVPR